MVWLTFLLVGSGEKTKILDALRDVSIEPALAEMITRIQTTEDIGSKKT